MSGWRKQPGSSKTGTCMRLESSSSSSLLAASRDGIPGLVLTWRGDEPLDRLHICIKATMTARSITNMTSNNLSSSSRRASTVDVDEDKITGHCSLSLEQLCKVAVAGATNNGGGFVTTAARILVSRGRPMYNIDNKSMQV